MSSGESEVERYMPPKHGLIDWILRWFERKEPYRARYEHTAFRRGQTCFVYCPNCESELSGNPVTRVDDLDQVHYVCGACGHCSVWDFDSYPVPVLVSA